MRSSIQWKFALLMMAAIVICVVVTGGISMIAVYHEEEKFSEREFNLLTTGSCDAVDKYLDSIEQSVNMVSHYAQEDLSIQDLVDAGVIGATGYLEDRFMSRDFDTLRQQRLEEKLEKHVVRVNQAFKSVSNHTNGVVAYYYRINPEITRRAEGFFYSKVRRASFLPEKITRIENYGPGDISRVGWYYIPLEHGRPSWMEPYYNANIDIEMLSYVVPIYKGGTFIGLVGMDIAYETLVSHVKEVSIYKTGYGFLVNSENRLIYHPALQPGADIRDLAPELAKQIQGIRERENGGEIIPLEYTYNGVLRRAACGMLSNGLILVLSVPASEITAEWYRILQIILLTSALLFGSFLGFTILMVRKVTKPLTDLTNASLQLAAGNYDVLLTTDGSGDEVDVLTSSFRQLVEHLKIYIDDLNSRAYRDALTGVRNKGAYDIKEKKIDEAIRAALSGEGEMPRFSVIMFDCNDLKGINDNYGHERGDIYLQTACRLICKVFVHSPVFRIGGDEFIAILEGKNYDKEKELIEKFKDRMDSANKNASSPWTNINTALGTARFDPSVDRRVHDVLRRADEQMYYEKRRMKDGDPRDWSLLGY